MFQRAHPLQHSSAAGEEDPEELPVDREGSLVDEYFPGHVEVDQKSGVAGLSSRGWATVWNGDWGMAGEEMKGAREQKIGSPEFSMFVLRA